MIIKLDALGASGEDVVGWESNIEGMDLDHERRSVLAERAPPSRDMATSPTAPAVDDGAGVFTSSSRTSSFERGRASFEDLDAARVKHLIRARIRRVSPPCRGRRRRPPRRSWTPSRPWLDLPRRVPKMREGGRAPRAPTSGPRWARGRRRPRRKTTFH